MNESLNIGSLDNHHRDVFEMVHRLDRAIQSNSRESFEPIIGFLEDHCTAHFQEEEAIMIANDFDGLHDHRRDHARFNNKIKYIRKMYNENIHTTHIAYGIRQLIDLMITHIQTVDIKMKGLSAWRRFILNLKII